LDTTKLRRRANGSCSYALGDVYAAVRACPLQNAHGALADSQAVLDLAQCTDMYTALCTAVTERTDTPACQNIMSMVRAALTRRSKPGLTQPSRRIKDMFESQTRRKKQRTA
jgi:trimethylamine:corrinoid methyltransferase-like protein